LALGFGPKAIYRDEAVAMDHHVHACLVILIIVGLQITRHQTDIAHDKGHKVG
jgi:hypothetical protein